MNVVIRDEIFNRTTYFDDVTYIHLHSLQCKCGEVTIFKMRDKQGHHWSGQLDASDKMIIDDFVNI